jgi:hypothetical protein
VITPDMKVKIDKMGMPDGGNLIFTFKIDFPAAIITDMTLRTLMNAPPQKSDEYAEIITVN